MNFSFEGDYKQRRNINLGGAKSFHDKKSLVAKAQSERKARELERRRISNAIKIQSFYRGRKEAQRMRDQYRKILDQQLTSLPEDPSLDSLARCSRYLLLLYQAPLPADTSLASRFCQALCTPNHEGVSLLALSWNGQSEERLEAWSWLLQLLTKKAFLPLLGSSFDGGQAAPVMQCLVLLMDPSTYSALKQNMAKKFHARAVTYCVLKAQLLQVLRTLFERLHVTASHLLNDAARILVAVLYCLQPQNERVIGTESDQLEFTWSMVVNLFVSNIVSNPFLLDCLEKHIADQLLKRLPLRCILQSIVSEETLKQVAGTDAVAGLLINVTEIERVQVTPPDGEIMELHVNAILALLTDLSPDYYAKPREVEETHMRSDSDDSYSSASDDEDTHITPVQKTERRASVNPHTKSKLGSLFGARDITRLMKWFLTANLEPNRLISNMALYFSTLLLRVPVKKDIIMNTLIFHRWQFQDQSPLYITQILLNSWMQTDYARMFAQEDHLFEDNTYTMVVDQALADHWSVLCLLCEVYTRLLMTTGDYDFFDKTNEQFRFEQIIPLSQQLKNISFFLFWRAGTFNMEQSLNRTGLKIERLRTAVTDVLQQLHKRDSRRSFCPKDHWLVKGRYTAGFTSAAVAEELVITDEESSERQRARQPSRGKLARISPHLGVLNNIPFVIPFEQRVAIFRVFVENDKNRNHISGPFFHPSNPVTIRRNHVFEDGFNRLFHLGPKLKERVAISFQNEHGLEEVGIDGGGVFKEFLTSLGCEAFNTNYGLFLNTPNQYLYPNPSTLTMDVGQKLAFFEFLGLVIGKALYEGILLDVAFADFFLNACLGKFNYLDDLPSLDPELYKGLVQVKNYKGNVEDLCLDFTLTYNDFGESKSVDLIPNGSQVAVTNDNRIRYVHLVANRRLNIDIAKQSKAFFRGLSTIVDIKWLRMFNQQELQILLGGVLSPIDIDDLQKNTVYGGYSEQDETVVNFWKALRSFDNDHRKKFVKFVTSCSRPPLLGFKELQPMFSIRRAEGINTRLPTSSTCVNLLKLPQFSTYELLREKLLYAITADAGFDLS